MENIDKYLQDYKENINNFNKAYYILYELQEYILEKSLNKFDNITLAYEYIYNNIIKAFRLNLLSYKDGYISKAAERKILNILITDLKEKVKQLL